MEQTSNKSISLMPISNQKHHLMLTSEFNAQLSAFETSIDHDNGMCGQEFLVMGATFLNHIAGIYENALAVTFQRDNQGELAEAARNNARVLQDISKVLGVMAGSEPEHVDLSALKERLM